MTFGLHNPRKVTIGQQQVFTYSPAILDTWLSMPTYLLQEQVKKDSNNENEAKVRIEEPLRKIERLWIPAV